MPPGSPPEDHLLNRRHIFKHLEETFNQIREDYARALTGHCVGTMPVDIFKRRFLKEVPMDKEYPVIDFSPVLDATSERDMSKRWVSFDLLR